MNEENKNINSLSYKPNLQPTRDYYSEIDFDEVRSVSGLEDAAESMEVIDVTPIFSDSQTILNNIDRMESLMGFVPDDLSMNVKDILDGMKQVIQDNDIDYEILDRPETEYQEHPQKELPEEDDDTYYTERDPYEDTKERTDNYRDDYDFKLEENDPVVRVTVEVQEPSEERFLNEHNLHVAQIFNKYIKNLNTIMSNYFTKTISVLDLSSGKSLKYLLGEYTFSTDQLNNKNLQHLSDTIIKNQIINKQNIMLFNKMFNKKELQKHLRFCKVAALSRDRYHNQEYEDSTSLDGVIIDSLLTKERITADIRYKESFKSLFKFLKSQLDIMDEILNNTIETMMSKSILIKEDREGVELATNEELFVARYLNVVEDEVKIREEREAQLMQRQKEREENASITSSADDKFERKEDDDEESNTSRG